jgi:biopolymer transport protein ExbB/TolQ
MSHVKIHKHHFWTLIFSCLLFVWVTIHQTLADNNYSTWSTASTYSEEVNIVDEAELELNSAAEYSENVREKKAVFKEKFNKLLSKKLDKLSNEKLEKVADRIDRALERVEENEKLNLDKKEKIISQLLALLEVIEEKIEHNDEFSLEIDLEELLSV